MPKQRYPGCPKCRNTCPLGPANCKMCAGEEMCPKCREEVTGVKAQVGDGYRRSRRAA